jgi:hypothetical protein
MLKPLTAAIISTALTVQAVPAYAVDLNKAFSSLLGPTSSVKYNEPGRFQSGARTGFTGGGLELRVPRGGTSPALFTVSAPKIDAGCGGISAHFGGFSFISGQELVNMLKQIASGYALGFVTSLVMKTLCPACEAIVQELRAAAQQASRLAKDSCQWGQEAAARFLEGTGAKSGMNICAQTSSQNGASSDNLGALASICNTENSAVKWLREFNANLASLSSGNADGANIKSQAEKETLDELGKGNVTWRVLSAFDNYRPYSDEPDAIAAYKRKVLLMNIIGATLGAIDDKKSPYCMTADGTKLSPKPEEQLYCPPPMEMRDGTSGRLAALFMCGNPDKLADVTGVSPTLINDCKTWIQTVSGTETQKNKLWNCASLEGESTRDARLFCNALELVDESQIIDGEGFIIHVNRLLRKAVDRVRTDTPFDADDEGKRIIALIQTAPYPLYQAINAAAVYPASAGSLIDSLSILVAEQFAYAMLDDTFRITGRNSSGTKISQAQAQQLSEFLRAMRTTFKENRVLMNQSFAIQQAISEQIRQINVALQRQVMTDDLLGANRLAQTMQKAASANITAPKSSEGGTE